jgi:hypothetical protein
MSFASLLQRKEPRAIYNPVADNRVFTYFDAVRTGSTTGRLFRYLSSTLLDDAASSAQRISVETIHTIEEVLELSEKHS